MSVICEQVLRALQACFQFDSVAYVTRELFKRLLPPLVAQLRSGPSDLVQVSLAVDVAPREPAADDTEKASVTDVYGQTAVETLVELAASTGNDELWKPFNHQVLPCIPLSEHPLLPFYRSQKVSWQKRNPVSSMHAVRLLPGLLHEKQGMHSWCG